MATPQPKLKRFESRALLDQAAGRPCVLCDGDNCRTTVPAHLPGSFYRMPAGTGQKTHDWLVAHLCHEHHELMDGPWRRNPHMRLMALCLTLQRLFDEEMIVVADR